MKKIVFLLCSFFIIETNIALAHGRAKWYRYTDAGVPHISKTLTTEHIRMGYEELDSGFRVIQQHEPYDANHARQMRKDKEEQKNLVKVADEKKEKLLRNYDSSTRATRKRVEFMMGVNSSRLFAEKQVVLADNKLKEVIEQAATNEKSGQPITNELKGRINSSKVNLESAQKNLKKLVVTQYGELHDLTRDIRKLRKYEQSNK